jgi:heme/copper-type cytochrome/quinol oxidase subunit 3
VWGLIAIESTIFGLFIASYFYLRLNFPQWPPATIGPPDLWPGTLNMLVLLIGVVPLVWVSNAAKAGDQAQVQIGMVVATIADLIALVIRYYEFAGVHCRWDTHAYGSVVWVGLGLHTFHLVASSVENTVLSVYAFRRVLDGKHRLDLEMNSLYGYFVTFGWLPVYVVLYWVPRWIS